MDNGGIEPGWVPPPPPAVGSPQWKQNIAIEQALGMLGGMPEEPCVLKMMPCMGHEIGFLVIRRMQTGWDYFRVDKILDICEESKKQADHAHRFHRIVHDEVQL